MGAGAGIGAGVGLAAVQASGLSAAGMVGSGTGIGAAAGPVGAAFGAIAGLAVVGLLHVVPEKRERIRAARRRVGRWIAGEDNEEG
jgi:hypothetical protein